jgi:glycosyltransferase involved in cell wall biosynthesis
MGDERVREEQGMSGQSATTQASRPIKVLCVHYGEDWIAGSEIALLEMMRWFPTAGVQPALWCNARAMLEAAAELGVEARRDDLEHFLDYASPRFSPGAYLRQVRLAGRIIAETGADLVHCNSAAPAQWMRWACWRAGVPMVVNLHAPYLRRSRYVLGVHAADRIVAVAEAVAAPLLADGMPPARVSVVPNGFDFEQVLKGQALGLREALGIPDTAVIGAIAGSLILRKGHDILFEAMRRLDLPATQFQLLVVGDGPERAAYEALAAGLPVHFLGHRSDLGAVLRDASDFLIAPSRQEAFGRVIIEAAAAGKPSIGANVDGIPEAIVDGETGLLFDPQSPEALGRAMIGLIRAPEQRLRLGTAARERAQAEFSITACVARMRAEYDFALQSGPQPPPLAPYLGLIRPRGGRRPARGVAPVPAANPTGTAPRS